MRITRKYEFTDEAAADAAINLLKDSEGNLTQSVVKLGYLTIEGVESTKYAVDVSWSTEPLDSWDSAMVFPVPMGVHSFGSSSQRDEYARAYCELKPDSAYCNPPETEE